MEKLIKNIFFIFPDTYPYQKKLTKKFCKNRMKKIKKKKKPHNAREAYKEVKIKIIYLGNVKVKNKKTISSIACRKDR